MSLFTSFNVGVTGMTSSQSGINTTAHNLANTRTEGYTRQQNINKDNTYQNLKVTEKGTLQVGLGTTVACVRQIRDKFLDKEYRLEVGRQTFYEAQMNSVYEVEDLFGEMEGVEFNTELSDMWSMIQDLANGSDLITNRELFIAQADTFLEKANNIYSSLRNYQLNLNERIESQVKSINSIADKIGKLNLQIAKVEASGVENANDYRDARNQLMDELAEYTAYDYYEDADGKVTIRINNAPLVDETTVYHMACEKIKEQEYDPATGQYVVTSSSPMYTVVWEKSGFGEVYDLDKAYSKENDTDRGSLYGLLVARGKDYGYYTDIPVDPNKDQLDAYNNTTGNNFLEKIEAQLDLLVHKIVTAVNDAFCPNVETNLNGIAATDSNGNAVTLTGTMKVLDAYNCPVGADDDESIGVEVFSRKAQQSRYTIYTVNAPVTATDENGNTYNITKDNGDGTYSLYVYNEEDASDVNSLYTIQNLEVNQKLLADYSFLPVKGNPAKGATGTYDQSVFKNIVASWNVEDTVLDPNTSTTYSIEQLYDAIVGGVSTQGSVWKSEVDNQTKLTQSIEDKRQQSSGVSTEEEMVNLLTYQHAYNAASRYITAIDQMLEHLIEKLG